MCYALIITLLLDCWTAYNMLLEKKKSSYPAIQLYWFSQVRYKELLEEKKSCVIVV